MTKLNWIHSVLHMYSWIKCHNPLGYGQSIRAIPKIVGINSQYLLNSSPDTSNMKLITWDPKGFHYRQWSWLHISDFRSSELWELHFCCWYSISYIVLCWIIQSKKLNIYLIYVEINQEDNMCHQNTWERSYSNVQTEKHVLKSFLE